MNLMLFVRRSDLRIVEANKPACARYGYTFEELTHLSALDLSDPADRERARADFERVHTFDTLLRTNHVAKDGAVFPVEMSIHDAKWHGEDVVLCVVRDIEERLLATLATERAFKQALESSRFKSEFVATMSHEIRTPMNGVIGTTELLLRTELTRQQRDYALTIRESGEALLRVINDILDFSKMEAGKMEIESADFHVVRLVESVASLLTPQAHKKFLSLMTFIDPALPQHVVGDADRLRQVLLNLAGNAIKFTEAGSVLIAATIKESAAENVVIEFSVSDSGMGITPESQERLFRPFHQLDGSASRKHGGTGLGLSISQQLVHLMGGSITVQSAVGRGSVFAFSLELPVADAQPPELTGDPAVRVFIVDDDPISCNIIRQYVLGWNMTCEIATDPREVCPRLVSAFEHGEEFDVAIVDLKMPHIDGFALAEKIRSDDRFEKMRLILVTAFDKPESARASSSAFSAYLVKPLKQAQLRDTILNARSVVPSGEQLSRGPLKPLQPSGLRILVAEDNSINRQLALQQLHVLGYAADAVENGKLAVAMACTGEYDVILMDCQMPEMDGFEATHAIRASEARNGGRCRIIAMTANALSEAPLRCIDAGMDDYIGKPVTLERLQGALGGLTAHEDAVAQRAADENTVQAVLNMSRLRQIFSDDNTAIGPFLESALPVLGEMVRRLESCVTCDEGAAAVHELKGAAANLGAAGLSGAAALLEHKILAGSLDIRGIANTRKALNELADTIGRYERTPA
jgi:PAS domain S-box-containing protein